MKKILIFSICLLALVLCSLGLSSQAPADEEDGRSYVTIRNADFVRSFTYNGRVINRLIGNVIIDHEENGVVVTCDSAYMYTQDSLDLFGRVEMMQGAATIRCDKMTYDGTFAKVRGHIVQMTKDGMVLLTQHFDYNLEKETGTFFKGGTVEKSGETLESDRGYYYSKVENFIFAGNVALKNKDYLLSSDSLHYNMKTEDITFLGPTKIWRDDNFLFAKYGWQHKATDEIHFSQNVYMFSPDKELWADSVFFYQTEERGKLFGDIQLVDTVKEVMLFGEEMFFTNKPEYAEVTKDPVVVFYGEQKKKKETPQPPAVEVDTVAIQADSLSAELPVAKTPVDTLFLVSDTLRLISYPNPRYGVDSIAEKQDSLYRKIFAYFNVRVFRNDIQAVCDSLVVETQDSIGKMFINPILWSDSTQITSDSIRFTVLNGELRFIDFQSSAFITMQEDSIHFSQIRGRDMKALLANSAIYELDVFGNAQSIYYMREDGVVTSVNRSESSDLIASIKENQLTKVKYMNKPDSKIYPLDLFPEGDDRLKGFSWQIERRPKSREELFSKSVRPSFRQEAMKFVKPPFTITEQLKKAYNESWQGVPTFTLPSAE